MNRLRQITWRESSEQIFMQPRKPHNSSYFPPFLIVKIVGQQRIPKLFTQMFTSIRFTSIC
ncbi:hypothetical protein X975_10949, partial [Stegodyphus mimosarum]